uniref:50S ribosomal protein L22, chloroplastic n=1 Tax=Calcidiscus leptoporus TaxID=127549 RepID=A0A6U5K7P4_9EUKA
MARPGRALSSKGEAVNPLLNVQMPVAAHEVASPKSRERARFAIADFKDLPVSPKKLRVVANLVPRLYWREAMLQLEFCRKNMGVMVKNCVECAVKNAREQGLDSTRLVVDQCIVGKGSYFKKPDYKARGKVGVKRSYFSHLRVIVRELEDGQVRNTKNFGRWTRTASLLGLSWEQRIQQLPRYVPLPGYDPTGAIEMPSHVRKLK